MASSSKTKSHFKKAIKSVWEFKEGKKMESKKPSVQGWVTRNKGCKLVLKKYAPPTTSGPEHNQPNSPCNTVIHWGIYYYHYILKQWFKSGGGKGHHIKCWIPVYNGDNLDLKFKSCWGKDNNFKILSLTEKNILQKLGLKIH